MRSSFLLFFSIFFTVYGLVNFYIGLHARHLLRTAGLAVGPWLFWPLFWLVALSYILSRFLNGRLPELLYHPLHMTGAYWLAIMLYLFLILLPVDLVRLANHFFRFLPGGEAGLRLGLITGFLVILTVLGLVGFGAWNARRPVVTRYDITIDKPLGGIDELNIVLVSDIHLGTIVNGKMLTGLVKKVNELEPDLILLAGDILDEDLGAFVKRNMDAELGRLRAPLGVFAVPGNHEYIGGELAEFVEHMESAGITMLIDRAVKVADSFYVIGRDDLAGRRFTGKNRAPLADLVTDLDPGLPRILIDHQPYGLEEAEAAGIDLQVSGHTHRGQLWPSHLITGLIYELDYGYLRKGSTNYIVSSGYGTWGPPVRVGSRAELVLIRVSGASASARPTKP